MYLNYYKLNEFPFSLSCEGKYFYESSVHREALGNMLYAIQQRKGMVLITGEVGTGKSFVGNMVRFLFAIQLLLLTRQGALVRMKLLVFITQSLGVLERVGV